jgi:peptidoglycan/xylan/chitin deacetylase (PgdA/CDA1 family)
MKYRIKKIITFIVYYSGLIWLYDYFYNLFKKNNRAIVLGYHHVVDDGAAVGEPPTIYSSKQKFDKLMKILSKKFQVISLSLLVDLIRKNEPIPKRCVVITFDDGYKDNYEIAYPILLKHKLPATIFLTTRPIDSAGLLSMQKIYLLLQYFGLAKLAGLFSAKLPKSIDLPEKLNVEKLKILRQKQILSELLDFDLYSYQGMNLIDQIFAESGLPDKNNLFLNLKESKEMQNNNIDFGVHTVNHPRLSALNYHDQENEIVEAKNVCERILDRPMSMFCYPFGDTSSFNSSTIEILMKNGFTAACTINYDKVGNQTNMFELPRRIVNDQPIHELVCEIVGLFDFCRKQTG